MLELKYLSATEIGRLVNNREIRPVEVVSYFKDRIDKYAKDLNCFTYLNFDYAYKKAYELEERLNKGEKLGVFAGVPFALKDFLSSKKGWPCTHGGVECLKDIDEYNSVFCRAMEKADGIAIGKTNAPAFGFRGTTDNIMFGATKNPFDIRRNSGGSSGGSATAVAAGLVPIAEGGDAGGSIRIPASWCNLVGFKATNYYIPNVCSPDAYSATHPFCTCGGETKNIQDSINLFNLMRDYVKEDPQSREFKNIHKKDLKVGITYDFNLYNTDEKIKEALKKRKLDIENNLGITINEISFSFKHSLKEMAETWCKMISIDTTIELDELKRNGFDIEENRKYFPKEFLYYADEVRKMNYKDYYKWNLIKSDIYHNFREIFDKYDLIISPVTSCMPVFNTSDNNTLGPNNVEPLIGWSETFMINFIGNPAISIPCNLSKDNLPIGMQIIADKGNDNYILDFSQKLEKLIKWKDFYRLSMK